MVMNDRHPLFIYNNKLKIAEVPVNPNVIYFTRLGRGYTVSFEVLWL